MKDTDESIGEELARWGKVAWIETTGRRTGNPATAAVGFVEGVSMTDLNSASLLNGVWDYPLFEALYGRR